MEKVSELRAALRLTLSKYFRSEKRLEEATDDLLKTALPFISSSPPPAKPKGATIMTEAASASYKIKPEHL